MSPHAEEQNYWPGYLDALINVMLNLLFLVAIFAIGLVLLNLQTMTQRGQIHTLAGQAEHVIEELGIEKARKSALLQKLQSLDIGAMVANREELDRRQQGALLAARTAAPSVTVPSVPVADPTPPLAESLVAEAPPERLLSAERLASSLAESAQALARYQAAQVDKRRQAEEVAQQLRDLQTRLGQERARLLSLQQSRAAVPTEQVVEIRVMFAGHSSEPRASAFAERLGAAIGARVQAVWEFSPGEFAWASDRSPPEGLASVSKGAAWRLLGFVDPLNGRVRREVFARMQSIRDHLIAQGFVRERIELELRAAPAAIASDEQVYRLIFLLPVS